MNLLGLGKREGYGVVGQNGGEKDDERESSHHVKV